MEQTKRKRWRQSHGRNLIEVKVKSPQQLFDARDPAPFRERDLDDDFVEYVITNSKNFVANRELKLVIQLEESVGEISKEGIEEAIRSYFVYQSDLKKIDLKVHLRTTQLFFLIGFFILAICLGLSHKVSDPVIREGLVIFGWVTMWKPLELFLFDWYPLYQNLRVLQKLSRADLAIQIVK